MKLARTSPGEELGLCTLCRDIGLVQGCLSDAVLHGVVHHPLHDGSHAQHQLGSLLGQLEAVQGGVLAARMEHI